MHPQRSVITRALGTDPDVDVDTFVVDTQPGDIFLLCSDGLSGMVSDEAILSIVRDNRGDLQAAAKALIAAANRGGGDDNITVVVFAVDGDDEEATRSDGRDPAARRGRGRAGRRGHAVRPRGGARGRDDGRQRRRAPAAGGRRRRGGCSRRAPRASAAAACSRSSPCWPSSPSSRCSSCGRPPSGEAAIRVTARNRELLNLTVVGALTAIGFASVYIARQEVVSTSSLSYAGFFFTLYLAAHIVARVCVPQADPYLLPMAALLTAIGVTEIYRLNPDDAFRQGLWVVIGVGLFSATLFLLRRDYRRLETLSLPVRARRAAAARCSRRLPASAARSTARTSGSASARFQFQPGELAKIMLIVFLAGYLREKREVLAQGRLKDFGPLLVIWGGAMLVLFQTNDLGSGLLYFGIFLAMLYVATGRRLVRRGRSGPVRRRRDRRLPARAARAGARLGLARPLAARRRRGLPDRAVALLDGERRLRRHRARQGHVHDGRGRLRDPVPEDGLHLLGALAGARAGRLGRAPARVHALRAARLPRSR